MNLSGGLSYLLFAAISLLSASAAVVLTGYLQRVLPTRRRPSAHCGPEPDDPVELPVAPIAAPHSYEFADGALVSRVGDDDPFLEPDAARTRGFSALTQGLKALHPELPDRMRALRQRGEAFFLIGHLGEDALSISGRTRRERMIVTVAPAQDAAGRRFVDPRSFDAVEQELADLRRALALSAAIQWKETGDGRVVWANSAYLRLAERVMEGRADRLGWPLPRIFGQQADPPPREGTVRRCRLAAPDLPDPLWFEVAAEDFGHGTILFSARAIDRLVAAEDSLRDFIQTLSKTFAALPVGLAVFDHRRELVMFNPALVAISMLEPGYLTRRPSLRTFLDQLRERRRMPEPRDYLTWREEIARLEQGAEQGTYHELWTLPGGASLRVTGRPHPDGAVALMFEDISREISLTRSFRAELDLCQAILDDAAAAFAVFDRDGRVLRKNAAYDVMWGSDPDIATITEAMRRWQGVFAPTGLWGEIRDFAAHAVDRAAWAETLLRSDGAHVLCRVAPLAGGHTIVWFLSPDAVHDDPMAGWLPLGGPSRSELAPPSGSPEPKRTGEGAA